MVRKGFIRLDSNIQQRIIKAALEEFSSKDYDTASLNNIITEAGISKGSMYYYFHNKEDLYLYLIELCMEEKALHLRKAISKAEKSFEEMGFFDNLQLQLSALIDFAAQSSSYYQVILRLLKMPDTEMKNRIMGNNSIALDQYLDDLIREGQASEEIRNDFEPLFIKRVISFITTRFTDLYPDADALLGAAPDGDNLKNEMFMLVELLKKGLAAQR